LAEATKTQLSKSNKTILVHIGGKSLGIKYNTNTINKAEVFFILLKDWLYIVYNFLTNLDEEYLIYDRYIYDSIVKVIYKHGTAVDIVIKFFLWATPTPQTVFFIITDAEKTFSRDKDHSKEYHKIKNEEYKKLFSKVSHISVNNNNSKEEAISFIKTNII